MKPRARKANLTIRDLPDETLVYDHERHKAHCLNAAAALVWKHCDGETSLEDLEELMRRELGIEQASALVALALEQLARRHLLEDPQPPSRGEARASRREALRQLALAAALPVILTIATRTAAQSLSDGSSDGSSGSSSPPVSVTVSVVVPGPSSSPPSPPTAKSQPAAAAPCRTKGQSCLASASGQQGTCCAGLTCTGVAQGAGVCA
jgi:hypothetical protein